MALTMTTASGLESRWSMASLKSALPSPYVTATLPLCSSSLQFQSRLSLSLRKPSQVIRSFTGLSPLSHFPSINFVDHTSSEHRFTNVNNGFRISAMRHGRRVPKLNRPPDQRRALLRGLTTQLLKHGRIKTTRARASAMRKYVEKMITLAKDGSLHKRRQALGFVYEKQIVHALFAEVPDRYGERNGGYTRIIRTLPRRGDNAPMAYIELV
ncbi:hypothetical protein K2173_015478 [Erythroxylum novogranatense]|uniref:Large ribosomal subunit protein bL17c n=1 Tax=Erythroxylum novogranatense TaxID=1862640 RepID=A0AAV8SSJ3_9ROSI|nr:hypothetical protein K2173_015478 [Erythroxylum novogranatense]